MPWVVRDAVDEINRAVGRRHDLVASGCLGPVQGFVRLGHPLVVGQEELFGADQGHPDADRDDRRLLVDHVALEPLHEVFGLLSADPHVADRRDLHLRIFVGENGADVLQVPAGLSDRVADGDDDAAVEISVSDQGIGIARGDREKVFERFFQADASSTRKYGGMGLGLSIVREIVQAHGREITVESELGRGSTFHFTLPVAGAPKLVRARRSLVRAHAREARRGKAAADRRRRR